MGTSTRWPGPKQTCWRPARRQLNTLFPSPESVPIPQDRIESVRLVSIEEFLDADVTGPPMTAPNEDDIAAQLIHTLAAQLRADPASFGLLTAVHRAGHALVKVLDELLIGDLSAVVCADATESDERTAEFLARFADRVSPQPGLFVDALTRRSAVRCAAYLVEQNATLRAAVRSGTQTSAPISSNMFCAVYRLFFQDAITGFLEALVASKIVGIVPVLPAVDPAGHLAGWIAHQLVGLIPTPCDELAESTASESLGARGHRIVTETIEGALGLSSSEVAP